MKLRRYIRKKEPNIYKRRWQRQSNSHYRENKRKFQDISGDVRTLENERVNIFIAIYISSFIFASLLFTFQRNRSNSHFTPTVFQQAQSCTFPLTRSSLSRRSRRATVAKRWYLPTVIFQWNPLFFARREVGGAALKLSGANWIGRRFNLPRFRYPTSSSLRRTL